MINRGARVRVIGSTVVQKLFTCSTGDVLSGAAINGNIIDRLGLGARYQFRAAQPFINVYSTVGATSTGIDRKVALDIKLQHGDSSGGGDMADYDTGQAVATRTFGTTQLTTLFQNWSTGSMSFDHTAYYEITAAKRYIRPVGVWTRAGIATATAVGGVDGMFAYLGVALAEADNQPFVDSSSTSTSTST